MKAPIKLLVATILLSFLTACENSSIGEKSSPISSPSANASNGVTKIDVKEKEMEIIVSSDTAPAGSIDFVIHNVGRAPHELVIFKTDLPLDKLPQKQGALDEEAASLKNVADTGEKNLNSGEVRTLRANLSPGKYVMVCNLPGHFQAGMKTAFFVK